MSISRNDNLEQEVGAVLRSARLTSGLTQSELAKKVKTKQPAISSIESGTKLPSLTFIRRIANAYGAKVIPPQIIFYGKRQKTKTS